MPIKHEPFESSTIESAGFDAENGILEVKFKTGGATYRYHHATPELWQAFKDAPSKGGYLHKAIKSGLPSYKVGQEDEE